jgi:hypothetical protein
MKYVFLAVYYLGWGFWSAPQEQIFDNYDDCHRYITEMSQQLRFCKVNNCAGSWPSDWEMSCKPSIITDEDKQEYIDLNTYGEPAYEPD